MWLRFSDTNFNPRTHRGVRPRSYLKEIDVTYFNPRTHRGVRLSTDGIFGSGTEFQSTHPSWGATVKEVIEANAQFISIHAPIVGCDMVKKKETFSYDYFNPRTHRGVRRRP